MNDLSTERAGRSVSLTWYGQAGFRLAAGSSRILIDPFLTDRDDRNYRPPARAADFADVTLVLCTHERRLAIATGSEAARAGQKGMNVALCTFFCVQRHIHTFSSTLDPRRMVRMGRKVRPD